MQQSRWWKCDLQVATPAWNFKLPSGENFDFSDKAERIRFLDLYMQRLNDQGIEVIALADHNTGEWIDDAKAAGLRHNIIVFPGCEITSHTGSDGVHLVVLGDLGKTSQDFDRLIHGSLGFDNDHVAFRKEGDHLVPGTSGKSAIQILDDLPDGYLAFAPHALSENGIVSGKTAQGDIRWKSFNHPRLSAVDAGDCSGIDGGSFNSKFRQRQLAAYPRLSTIAFISTSDAYDLESLGSNFCWIRMGQPSIEALRQAFLDHESRILCDWSPDLLTLPAQNPNSVRHGWVKDVLLGGVLGNSSAALRIPLHHGLNVLIGGRGSGKSTVVAAIRELFSDRRSLPTRLREDADSFVETVFSKAHLSATYALPESQEVMTADWALDTGSITSFRSESLPTDFPVVVISQKELFERASGDKADPFVPSRSLFALLDDRVGLGGGDSQKVGSWSRRCEDARVEWANAARSYLELAKDVGQLKQLREQITTLHGQVDAFAAPEVKARLARIDARRAETALLREEERLLEAVVEEVNAFLDGSPAERDIVAPNPPGEFFEEFLGMRRALRDLKKAFVMSVTSAVDEYTESKERWAVLEKESKWYLDAQAAEKDLIAYTEELKARGLSPAEFSKLQEKLRVTRETVKALEAKETKLPTEISKLSDATNNLLSLFLERRSLRKNILTEIQERSGRLKFVFSEFADLTSWQESVRALCGFRIDAFRDDVTELAQLLWSVDEERNDRWALWRGCLARGDLSKWMEKHKCRPAFAQKLASLDGAVRYKLATEVPDDVVTMYFLREGGGGASESEWQPITEGSPGQRTAAMLAFVLHHGNEPLVLDQPEDDLDSEWISKLVVKELRASRLRRQLIVVSHNANIPVLGDADQVITLENKGSLLALRASRTRSSDGVSTVSEHVGPVEYESVRTDIQNIMEGGVTAFVQREQRYHCETQQSKSDKGSV
ncbi:TrlF family AAA-like ATPase [Burkholderia sp. L27(2015)]|uniref:TrlF family AAA-like ATPase n=1 Tax=Burkholderia sp. L27(2015) TaxID=1641858 RepID=UPI00131CDECB|nr:hypothetical protein [Burkholderia sp. L27(2015)]